MDAYDEVAFLTEDSEERGQATFYIENYVNVMPEIDE